jgi:hypothetical protein
VGTATDSVVVMKTVDGVGMGHAEPWLAGATDWASTEAVEETPSPPWPPGFEGSTVALGGKSSPSGPDTLGKGKIVMADGVICATVSVIEETTVAAAIEEVSETLGFWAVSLPGDRPPYAPGMLTVVSGETDEVYVVRLKGPMGGKTVGPAPMSLALGWTVIVMVGSGEKSEGPTIGDFVMVMVRVVRERIAP